MKRDRDRERERQRERERERERERVRDKEKWRVDVLSQDGSTFHNLWPGGNYLSAGAGAEDEEDEDEDDEDEEWRLSQHELNSFLILIPHLPSALVTTATHTSQTLQREQQNDEDGFSDVFLLLNAFAFVPFYTLWTEQ